VVRNELDFHEGFRQGARAILGSEGSLPVLARVPVLIPGRSPYQMGILRGIEYAKGWCEGSLIADTSADHGAPVAPLKERKGNGGR